MSVTYLDVAVSLGRPISTPAEQDQVTQWIMDAQTVIRARLGDLAELDQDLLDYVVREAVVLKVKRPDQASSTSVAVDDATVTRRYERDTGQISILDEWWALLTPDADDARGVFSARPYFEADTSAWPDTWTYTTP